MWNWRLFQRNRYRVFIYSEWNLQYWQREWPICFAYRGRLLWCEGSGRFNQLLNTYNAPGSVLGTAHTEMNKTPALFCRNIEPVREETWEQITGIILSATHAQHVMQKGPVQCMFSHVTLRSVERALSKALWIRFCPSAALPCRTVWPGVSPSVSSVLGKGWITVNPEKVIGQVKQMSVKVFWKYCVPYTLKYINLILKTGDFFCTSKHIFFD